MNTKDRPNSLRAAFQALDKALPRDFADLSEKELRELRVRCWDLEKSLADEIEKRQDKPLNPPPSPS
jgi:hypothetical protein